VHLGPLLEHIHRIWEDIRMLNIIFDVLEVAPAVVKDVRDTITAYEAAKTVDAKMQAVVAGLEAILNSLKAAL